MQAPPAMPASVKCDAEAARAVIAEVLAAGRTDLSEREAKALLRAYGIPVVETEVARTPREAGDIARRMLAAGGDCVVKVLSADISHKSDVGGVRLGLDSAEAAETAAREILERVARVRPGARIDGFTVQPMVRRPNAHELILGMTVDETFGPMLMFGAGGVAVEGMKDTRQALPPLDLKLAHELMRGTRIHRLLQGYRDRPPARLDEVALALVRLGSLVIAHPEIRELDINPLLADENGVIALDARVRVQPAEAGEARLAIRPYPRELEETVAWCDKLLLLRPIRPDDEARHLAFLQKLDPEDIRMRIFAVRRSIERTELARLTQIDYEREMAFIAVAPGADGAPETLGAVRAVTDPDNTRAEFGIIVRSDLKRLGLGHLMLDKMIRYCRGRGTRELTGDVLAGNADMLQLARTLGFETTPAPDGDLVRLRLPLAPAAAVAAGG